MNVLQETLVGEIRRLRTARKMDQQVLADAVKIGRSSISNIESGRQAVTLSLFCRIATALDKDPGEFLNEILRKSNAVSSLSSKDVEDNLILKTINDTIGSDEGGQNV